MIGVGFWSWEKNVYTYITRMFVRSFRHKNVLRVILNSFCKGSEYFFIESFRFFTPKWQLPALKPHRIHFSSFILILEKEIQNDGKGIYDKQSAKFAGWLVRMRVRIVS